MITHHAELLFIVPRDGSGSIWTGRPVTTDAVAVRDGRIVALGREALDQRGPSTDVIELAGRTLLPAFRDGHLHPLAGGAETLDCDLVDAADVAEVLARLRAFARATPDAPWVLGYGYPPEILPGGVGHANTLDAVVGDRPVALWSSDHHMVWCNTLALQRAGITAATIDPPRGTIVRDADGHPVVYDGGDVEVITEVTIEAGQWVHVTVEHDYTAKVWSLYLNGVSARTDLGFYNTGRAHYEEFNVSGAGSSSTYVDDIQILLSSPLDDLIYYTLTVLSAHGYPLPEAGEHSYLDGTSIEASVAGSPVEEPGVVQYKAAGWDLTGETPDNGSGTNVSFTLTGDTTLTWHWQTNYWVELIVEGE